MTFFTRDTKSKVNLRHHFEISLRTADLIARLLFAEQLVESPNQAPPLEYRCYSDMGIPAFWASPFQKP